MTDSRLAVDDLVQSMMADESVPGASVAVVVDGETIFARGYGAADLATERPVTPDTVFGIGSLGKSFTAVAVAQLVADGRVTLDTPAGELLPDLRLPEPFPTADITLDHLLSHVSGLPVLPALEMSLGWLESDAPMESATDLLRYIATMSEKPAGLPGERFSYSNDAFSLLGEIIERLSGESFATYMNAHVFGPLGMTRSTMADPLSLGWDDVTSLYDYEDGAPAFRAPWPQSAIIAPAGLHRSTANDMARYLAAHLSSLPGVPEQLHRELHRTRISRDSESGYALGWGTTDNFRGERALMHSGGITGVSSHALLLPERNAGVIALLNVSSGPSREIAEAVATELLGLPSAPEPAPYPLPDGELERVSGSYSTCRDTAVFGSDDGQPTMTLSGQPASSIVPSNAGEFRVTFGKRTLLAVFPTEDSPAQLATIGGRVYWRDE
ncbi:MAG: beta-lactamase family protein [Thermomicrobiales bacterium]|nr:beta-lactamase family protein [Thermomicrobiales bacterium]